MLCHFVKKGVPISVFSYFSLQGEDYSCIHFVGGGLDRDAILYEYKIEKLNQAQ